MLAVVADAGLGGEEKLLLTTLANFLPVQIKVGSLMPALDPRNHAITSTVQVIVPELIHMVRSGGTKAKTIAVLALSKLYGAAVDALPVLERTLLQHFGLAYVVLTPLTDVLKEGLVDRKLVAQAIRNLGATGEGSLIRMLQTEGNARIRAMAVFGLGLPAVQPLQGAFGSSPSVSFCCQRSGSRLRHIAQVKRWRFA